VLTFVHLDEPELAAELLYRLRASRYPLGWQVFAEVVRSPMRLVFYFGDMPHTWVGAEYVRALIGMLMQESDGGLELLPGTPPDWVADKGLAIDHLATAFGTLSISAQQDNSALRIQLGPGLGATTQVVVSWPTRRRPRSVTVDGKPHGDFDEGMSLQRPFHDLIAR
jgi:hypothetical protein